MNTKLINHEKYWLLVDVSQKAKGGEWELMERENVNEVNYVSDDVEADNKITGHLPKDNAPILEGVPLLPELPKQGGQPQ